MKKQENSLGRRLHIRALNQLRRDHPLTYVAFRNLSENIYEDGIESWTLDHMLRRLSTGRNPVYWNHSLFKGIDDDGNADYRSCLIGSPTTHLTEIWTLWRISQDPAFRIPSTVYSHLWPSPTANQAFQSFLKGYRRRERAIADAASRLSDPYVVVLDLKKFYPSVDTTIALDRFVQRIQESSLDEQEKEIATESARGVCRPRKNPGLPVGPPLAHNIASIFLQNLDDLLERKFPDRYFRYVDDVALVVERGQVDEAQRTFHRVVETEGLRVNDDKTDVHQAGLWTRHVAFREELEGTDGFGELVKGLTQYLAHNPEDFDVVHSMFGEAGFALPFIRARSIAKYAPFRRLARRALRVLGTLGVMRSVQPVNLLATAHNLRSHFEERARALAQTEIPSTGIERRWAIQNLRFVFNRLLYLLADSDLSEYLNLLPELPDLAPTRVVYNSLVTGDASSVVDFPGPPTTAVCQLWRERRDGTPTFKWPSPAKPHHRDPVITLALYRLCDPPKDWVETFDSQYSQPALRISLGERPTSRSLPDFSYIDEVESLCMTAKMGPLQLLESRFDKDESIVLPALSLGTGSET